VTALPSVVKYDFSRNVAVLTEVLENKKQAGFQTLGLTETKFKLSSDINGSTFIDPKTNQSCIKPVIRVKIEIGPQVVSIAKEFSRDTCSFWEIAGHELRHVRANQSQAEAVALELQAAMNKSFNGRVFYGTREELEHALSENVSHEWLKWGIARFDLVKATHKMIDSPEEYARSNTMCNGEVPRILSQPKG
jgi:hypothetical protein